MNTRISRWSPAVILLIAGSTQSLAAGPFGAALELSALNGTDGFVLNGVDNEDQSGRSVSSAGDVNGDGIGDLIIGAVLADSNGSFLNGESYVVFGGCGIGVAGALELSSLNGANGFVLNGISNFDRSGQSVSAAGDVNGDGIDDLIIGAPVADPNGSDSGESYVVFGGVGIGASGSLNLSALNGTNGFVCNGVGVEDQSGWSVSSAGDVNGDGFDDIIIGVYGYAYSYSGPTITGRSYVVFGGAGVGAGGSLDLSTLNGANGFVCNGIDPDDRCGYSVSSAGDVNGDGFDDIIIGAYNGDPNGISNSGESYVVFGGVGVGAGGTLDLSTLNGTNGFVCNGVNANNRSGRSVSAADDVNGDGVDDLIIGASNGGSGRSYVVFGEVGIGSGGTIELSTLTGSDGFVLNGVDNGDKAGFSVSSAGDVSGDGIGDLIIGAIGADPNSSNSGESYVVFGNVGIGSGGALNLSTLSGINGFVCNGIDATDYSGYSVSGAGDVNGDGADDFIIGAHFADPNGVFSGESYVVFGYSFVLPGDINGDCVVDTADLGILLGNFGGTCPP